MAEYIPGVCNIGPAEIAQRKKAGWLGTGVSIIFFLVIIIFHISPFYRLFIFFPIALAATGFLQAYFHFCANFGLRGVYNILKPVGQTETIVQKEFRKKDRQKALKIIGSASLVGLILTGFTYFLPL